MKWEIPDEPADVFEVWGPDESGDGWVRWTKPPMPQSGARKYWRPDGASDGGPNVWHTWLEVLGRGPVQDKDPNPGPPDMAWSPSRATLYTYSETLGHWVATWARGGVATGIAVRPADDAVPVGEL